MRSFFSRPVRGASIAVALTIMVMLYAILASQASAYTSQAVAVATVNVINCPFSATLAPASSIFVQPANIVLSYSVNTVVPASQCSSIPHLSGTAVVENSTSSKHYGVASLTINDVTNVPVTGNIIINSTLTYDGLQFPPGTDIGTLNLSYGGNSNTAVTGSFEVASPANVQITGFSPSPASISESTSVNLNSNLTNVGTLAATNSTLYLMVTAPGGSTYAANSAVGTISPSRQLYESLAIPGSFSSAPGTYTAVENVSYYSTYSIGNTVYTSNLLYTRNVTTTYVVQSSGRGGGSKPPATLPTSPPATSQVAFSQLPVLTSLPTGNSTLTTFGFNNRGTTPIWVNFTLPKVAFGSMLLQASPCICSPHKHCQCSCTLIRTLTQPQARTSSR